MASEVVSAKSHEGPLPQRIPARAPSDDLFDFPKVEMQLSGAAPAETPLTSAGRADPATGVGPEARAGSGDRRAKSVREVRANAAAAEALSAALPSGSPTTRAPLPGIASAPRAAAMSRAQPATASGLASESASRRAAPAHGQHAAPRRSFFLRSQLKRTRARGIGTLALLLFLFANLGAWWTFAHSAAEVRESVSELRSELLARATRPASSAQHAQEAPSSASASNAAHASESISGTSVDDDVLASSGELALEVARAEIVAGEWASARRRLHRLLASVDRIEAPRRGTIAMQAEFLSADSYRRAAESAREAGR